MARAVVLSAVRTPVGRYGGVLSGERPDDLAALVISEAVSRAAVPAEAIEDVYFGAANQAGEDNRNVARMAALLSGLPESVAGVTVNRLCASGLSAVVSACHAVVAGDGEARRRLPARQPDRLGLDAGLALPEPATGGEVPARVHGRDGRERGRALRRLARGAGRVRAAVAAAVGGRTRGGPVRR